MNADPEVELIRLVIHLLAKSVFTTLRRHPLKFDRNHVTV